MALTTFSVGHSAGTTEAFLRLLRGAGIDAVVDVRSQPTSAYAPQFNMHEVQEALVAAGIDYQFMGDELGGRPPEPRFYDADGRVLYSAMAQSTRYLEGIERLLSLSAETRVAIMCAEEDPIDCHRRLLIGRTLSERNRDVVHLRADGSQEREAEVLARVGAKQTELFASQEVDTWKSIRPVLRRRPRNGSSLS